MGMPAARVSDMHVCPMVTGVVPHVGGPILPAGSPTVLIGGLPAARVGDMCTCVGPPDTIVKGSTGVMIGGMPAARMGDITSHGGNIVLGCFTVLIGEASAGGGGGGAAGGGAGASGMSAGQAAGSANSNSLSQAAENGDETAQKTTPEDYSAQYTLVDEADQPVSGRKYQIRTPDGTIHEGKTNSSGQTESISGVTTSECTVSYFN